MKCRARIEESNVKRGVPRYQAIIELPYRCKIVSDYFYFGDRTAAVECARLVAESLGIELDFRDDGGEQHDKE